MAGCGCTYITADTVHEGAKPGTDTKVLKEKLSLNWTGSFKSLTVGPSPSDFTPDGRPLVAAKVLYFNLHSDMPGPGAHKRVLVAPCKP